VSKPARKNTGSLFLQILIGIVFPLIVLMIAFSFLLVKRELALEEKYFAQQGKVTLSQLKEQFTELSLEGDLKSPTSLREKIDFLKRILEVNEIDLIDPMREKSFLQTTAKGPNKRDLINALKSLSMKREGKLSLIEFDEKSKRLLGYLPLLDELGNRLVVAKIEMDLPTEKTVLQRMLGLLIGLGFTVLLVGFLISILLSIRIINPLKAINNACRDILNGKLGTTVKVRSGDEIEVIARNFNEMSRSLLAMQRRAADSNPLTGLPGNREIVASLVRRIEAKEKFVFFHIDIDHFKAFNDRYGLAAGDDVLKKTGQLLVDIVKEYGKEGNFVGHQGGDDYVMILKHEIADAIGKQACLRFDALLQDFYDKDDLMRGYFIAEDTRSEDHEMKKHRIMSLSLAGVSNRDSIVTSYREILDYSIRVKKKAKKIPFSKAIIEEIVSDVPYLKEEFDKFEPPTDNLL
jgi:diguanylate cyclase (GGDEF)-like protein